MSIAAGARRTETAYGRFLDSHAASDFVIGNGFAGPQIDLDAIARLPSVATAARVKALVANGRTESGRTIFLSQMAVLAPADNGFGGEVDRWKMLSGRRADPRRVEEAVAGFQLARRYNVEVGDTITLQFQREASLGQLFRTFAATLPDRVSGRTPSRPEEVFDGPEVKVTVVGIQAAPFDFPPLASTPPLVVTPAFYDAYADGLFHTEELRLRVRDGVTPAAFYESLVALGDVPTPRARDFEYDTVQPPLHLQAVVLWSLAALVCLAVGVSVALALKRQTLVDSTDFWVLRALGMSRRQLIAIGGLRAAVVGVGSAVLGALVAFVSSPLWPVGLARDAEPSPGFALDVPVFLLGGVLVVLGAICVGVVSTVQITGALTDSRARRSAPTWRLQRALPFAVGIGIDHAIRSGRRRDGVSVRAAICALSLAVAVVVTAVTFAASTDHLLRTPRLYGWVRDADISTGGLPGFDAPIVAGLRANPDVASIAVGGQAVIAVDGVGVVARGLDDVRGRVPPALLEGRGLRADDEILLATETMADASVRVGDSVTARSETKTMQMRVVGRVAFAAAGDFKPQSDKGVQVTLSALRVLVRNTPIAAVEVTYASHANPVAVTSRLRRAVAPLPLGQQSPPDEIIGFGRATRLPFAVALIMSAIAASSLAYGMTNSVRRRRREFALLATLGCVRRQLGAMVIAQAVVITLIACAIGIPLGIVCGRWAWNAVADALTVSSAYRGGGLAVVLVVPGFLIFTSLIALLPAALARRARPAVVLRTE